MPDNAEAAQELVRVLEDAVQAGVTSIGLERKDRRWLVFYQVGNVGLGANRIAEHLQDAVIEELYNRAGLERKPKGKFKISLLGKDFEVAVKEYDSFGESAFELTLKKR